MRALKLSAFCFLLGILVVSDPLHSPAQFKGKGGDSGGKGGFGPPGGGQPGTPPSGGGFGSSGRGGFGGGPPDPARSWAFMSGGKDSIDLNDPSKSWMKAKMEREGRPIPPGGILTKEMFIADAERRMAAGGQGGVPPAPGAPGPAPVVMSIGPGGPTPGGPAPFPGPGSGGPPQWGGGGGEDRGAQRVREQDRNGDGRVSLDEADSRLRDNFPRIDTDRDGFITLDEYRAYYAQGGSRGGPGGGGPGGGPGGWGGDPNGGWGGGNWGPGGDRRDEKRETEEPKPVAMRYGHLPKDLPGWYDTDDADKDGQVALSEWLRAKKSIDAFQKMDLNDDGLVTADELLRFNRKTADDEKIAALNDPNGVRPSFATRGPAGGVALPGSTPTQPVSVVDRGGSRDRGGSDRGSSDRGGSDRGSADKGRPGPGPTDNKPADSSDKGGDDKKNPFRKKN